MFKQKSLIFFTKLVKALSKLQDWQGNHKIARASENLTMKCNSQDLLSTTYICFDLNQALTKTEIRRFLCNSQLKRQSSLLNTPIYLSYHDLQKKSPTLPTNLSMISMKKQIKTTTLCLILYNPLLNLSPNPCSLTDQHEAENQQSLILLLYT